MLNIALSEVVISGWSTIVMSACFLRLDIALGVLGHSRGLLFLGMKKATRENVWLEENEANAV